jgi:ubiquitin C-terminal hydrolase
MKINNENKGLSGLLNLGNTCFINACFQILSHTYEFNEILNKKNYRHKLNNKCDSALLVEWDELKDLMWKKNCIISPNKLIKTIQKIAECKNRDLFINDDQNDLPEFLIFVIDCFHNALLRKVNINIEGISDNETDELAILCFEMIKKMYSNEYSEIVDIFYGIHVSQIIHSGESIIIAQKAEPYFMIDLPIPQHKKSITLYDCFDLYVQDEMLENENAWFNEKTGQKENVKKKISFWSFPNVLIIDLKRINPINYRKNQVCIDFPLSNLDLSKYVIGYKKENYVYECYGIANHTGNVLGGHYTACIKNTNGKWYHINDAVINEIINLKNLVCPQAYCLFYRKMCV